MTTDAAYAEFYRTMKRLERQAKPRQNGKQAAPRQHAEEATYRSSPNPYEGRDAAMGIVAERHQQDARTNQGNRGQAQREQEFADDADMRVETQRLQGRLTGALPRNDSDRRSRLADQAEAEVAQRAASRQLTRNASPMGLGNVVQPILNIATDPDRRQRFGEDVANFGRAAGRFIAEHHDDQIIPRDWYDGDDPAIGRLARNVGGAVAGAVRDPQAAVRAIGAQAGSVARETPNALGQAYDAFGDVIGAREGQDYVERIGELAIEHGPTLARDWTYGPFQDEEMLQQQIDRTRAMRDLRLNDATDEEMGDLAGQANEQTGWAALNVAGAVPFGGPARARGVLRAAPAAETAVLQEAVRPQRAPAEQVIDAEFSRAPSESGAIRARQEGLPANGLRPLRTPEARADWAQEAVVHMPADESGGYDIYGFRGPQDSQFAVKIEDARDRNGQVVFTDVSFEDLSRSDAFEPYTAQDRFSPTEARQILNRVVAAIEEDARVTQRAEYSIRPHSESHAAAYAAMARTMTPPPGYRVVTGGDMGQIRLVREGAPNPQPGRLRQTQDGELLPDAVSDMPLLGTALTAGAATGAGIDYLSDGDFDFGEEAAAAALVGVGGLRGGPRGRLTAAIRDPETGRVFTGANHAEAIGSAPRNVQARLEATYAENGANVGFQSADGAFMDRDAALASLGDAAFGRAHAPNSNAASPIDDLNAAGERVATEARTGEDLLAALPTNPEQWREAVSLHPWFAPRRGGPSASRTQAVIMASARKPDGSFVYSTDDIINKSGYASESSLSATLTGARNAGIPVPERRTGRGGPTAPPGGRKLHALLDAFERMGDAASYKGLAERVGGTPNGIYQLIFQGAHPERFGRTIPEAVRNRALAAYKAMGRGGSDPLTGIALGTGVGGGAVGLDYLDDGEIGPEGLAAAALFGVGARNLSRVGERVSGPTSVASGMPPGGGRPRSPAVQRLAELPSGSDFMLTGDMHWLGKTGRFERTGIGDGTDFRIARVFDDAAQAEAYAGPRADEVMAVTTSPDGRTMVVLKNVDDFEDEGMATMTDADGNTITGSPESVGEVFDRGGINRALEAPDAPAPKPARTPRRRRNDPLNNIALAGATGAGGYALLSDEAGAEDIEIAQPDMTHASRVGEPQTEPMGDGRRRVRQAFRTPNGIVVREIVQDIATTEPIGPARWFSRSAPDDARVPDPNEVPLSDAERADIEATLGRLPTQSAPQPDPTYGFEGEGEQRPSQWLNAVPAIAGIIGGRFGRAAGARVGRQLLYQGGGAAGLGAAAGAGVAAVTPEADFADRAAGGALLGAAATASGSIGREGVRRARQAIGDIPFRPARPPRPAPGTIRAPVNPPRIDAPMDETTLERQLRAGQGTRESAASAARRAPSRVPAEQRIERADDAHGSLRARLRGPAFNRQRLQTMARDAGLSDQGTVAELSQRLVDAARQNRELLPRWRRMYPQLAVALAVGATADSRSRQEGPQQGR